MSEMSAEKKKEIEKYIIESYFGHYKNVKPVKPYIGGVDLISGFCDIPDLLVEVEFFSSEMIIVRWNVRSESVSVWKNEFTMRVCREREIERNRCDSVDAMSYAWEAWKSKIQGKPIFLKTNDEDLQKDKLIEELERTVKALRAEKEVMERHIQELEARNVSLAETNNDKKCIEFLMYSMVATNKPHKEDTEITIAGLIPGIEILSTPIPFDIPCDVVVVPKKDFEALKTSNSAMQKELEHEIDTWQKATGRISPEEAKQYIERLKDRLNKIHDYSVDW